MKRYELTLTAGELRAVRGALWQRCTDYEHGDDNTTHPQEYAAAKRAYAKATQLAARVR